MHQIIFSGEHALLFVASHGFRWQLVPNETLLSSFSHSIFGRKSVLL